MSFFIGVGAFNFQHISHAVELCGYVRILYRHGVVASLLYQFLL